MGMKKGNKTMLLFAIGTVVAMISIAISIGEGSLIGITLSMLATIAIMGFGFKTKKKLRESGQL